MHILKTVSVVQELRALTLNADGSISGVFTSSVDGGVPTDIPWTLTPEESREVISATLMDEIVHKLYQHVLKSKKVQGEIAD